MDNLKDIIISSSIIIVIFVIAIIICFVFNPFCRSMYCFISPYFPFFFKFFMPEVKEYQSHSLHLTLAYFIFVTTIFS